jgi:glutathione S-transferase
MSSTQIWFAEEKNTLGLSFPNLPYFVDTDGFCMTETLAIHEYIA